MPINNMQANYEKKMPTTLWDPVHIQYPVRKFPETGISSETIGHECRSEPDVIKNLKHPLDQMKEYFRDYNITKELMQSQSTKDLGFKLPETKRFNKHTSCNENLYLYPPSRRLTDQPPQVGVHGTTEARSAYKIPMTPARLVTDKDQYKYPASLPNNQPPPEPIYEKELEPLDTTHDGFEKYLDPYLTTSRLHHRPFTANQQERISAANILTYYTFSDTTMVRTPKRVPEDWRLPLKRPQSMYDREKFKQDAKDIRTHHNRLKWVPGSFRTEVRDNFTQFTSKPGAHVHNQEEDVQTTYRRNIANLSTNTGLEHLTILQGYKTINSISGSNKPVCAFIDQYPEKNKKLEIRENNFRERFC